MIFAYSTIERAKGLHRGVDESVIFEGSNNSVVSAETRLKLKVSQIYDEVRLLQSLGDTVSLAVRKSFLFPLNQELSCTASRDYNSLDPSLLAYIIYLSRE